MNSSIPVAVFMTEDKIGGIQTAMGQWNRIGVLCETYRNGLTVKKIIVIVNMYLFTAGAVGALRRDIPT